ncbi:MAG: hypothetical protein K0U19_03585 [Proteobacteria bacterium]|nr:hypothetical protein [Pseudomonadota bacterium]
MTEKEKEILKIVSKNPGIHTTGVAEKFDIDDWKKGQNKTRKILMCLQEKKFLTSEKIGKYRRWWCVK